MYGEVLHYTGMGKVGDPKTSSYKLNKIIWFICSGIFYLNDISGSLRVFHYGRPVFLQKYRAHRKKI